MEPCITYPFQLDEWQKAAITAIHAGENVLVTAKTGSGKTLVGEYQIAFSLKKKKRVFYTTPIKSLTNQKFHDLKHLFPENSVGIMTGDIKSNPEADIVVMTTEILRNLLFKENTSTAHIGTAGQLSMENLDAVVFDEVHYINDPERGHVWEETLILLPPPIHLILLSATIDSAPELAAWLTKAKNIPTRLLQTTHRIVPLIHGIYDSAMKPLPLRPLKDGDEAPYNSNIYTAFLRQREQEAKGHDKWVDQVRNARRAGDSLGGSDAKISLKSFNHQLNECIGTLKERDLLPALFFSFSRKDCERYAHTVTHTLIDSSEIASVKHIINFHLHRYDEQLKHLPQFHTIRALLERGIGFHHSGLLPLLKEITELLFAKGYIKVLFCTETFAVGLNMPTRTAVFLDLKKPSDGGFRPLRADEYIQMAGRAGRRGKDKQGIVLYLPARNPIEPDDMRTILSGALQPLTSRLQFHYDFVLKALHAASRSSDADKKPVWESVVDGSYWMAQREAARDAAAKELANVESQMKALRLTKEQELELEERAALKEQIATTTNAARRKAQVALERWSERHVGPTWKTAEQLHQQKQKMRDSCEKLQRQIAEFYKPNGSRIEPVMNTLTAWGALSNYKMTGFGLLATEVNEANPLLLAKLYDSALLRDATPLEIVQVLGSFIVDKEALDKSQDPAELSLAEVVKKSMYAADDWGRFGTQQDRLHDVESPEEFWSLSTYWCLIAGDWFRGDSAAEIATRYEIYEGNLMRGLHKLANLVNEWCAMATIRGDVDMLSRLAETPAKLLRDIAIPESLYLRL
jgi:superfamily II RNA helicase